MLLGLHELSTPLSLLTVIADSAVAGRADTDAPLFICQKFLLLVLLQIPRANEHNRIARSMAQASLGFD
jgi:hypothetical protein